MILRVVRQLYNTGHNCLNTINQKITFVLYGQTWRMHLIKLEIALHMGVSAY